MKDFSKSKLVTGLIVTATIILAGVAIFTALRLYQLRKQAVAPTAPESKPYAWDCQKYTFSVSSNGTVTVQNNSSRDEPSQQAKVFIDQVLVATLDVPNLPKGQSSNLGTVQVPSGSFSWRVVGTKDCSSSGVSGPVACELLTFTITQESPTPTPPVSTITPTKTPTPTPLVSPGVTSTPTPTEPPIGGTSPTSTPTPTSREIVQASPTPSPGGLISATSPTPTGAALPGAGVSLPTLFSLGLAILVISLALVLAI